MGTRSDYYVGSTDDTKNAEWIGSHAWDGYPKGVPAAIITATTEEAFRSACDAHTTTKPSRGWPWPWDTSATTDYAYLFDRKANTVVASCFGGAWFDPKVKQEEDDDDKASGPEPVWPDMSARKNVRWDSEGSGVIIVGMPS